MKKKIHVNMHLIRAISKQSEQQPPLTVKTYKANTKAYEVEITGPSKVV